MCGGFTCSKRALAALNILYIFVAFVLIGVAVYGRASAKVVDLPIVGGILACGVFLILISILGLIGAVRHHQVVLFFYMVILFMLFLVQFSVACACLSVNKEQQRQLAKEGWSRVSPELREEVENLFHCCGFDNSTATADPLQSSNCHDPKQTPCIDNLQTTIEYAFELCGGIGLFFSFTEVIAAWVACRYRNQFDPAEKAAAYMFPRNRIY